MLACLLRDGHMFLKTTFNILFYQFFGWNDQYEMKMMDFGSI